MLKQRVRDYIDPDRDLGHSDKHGKKKEVKSEETSEEKTEKSAESGATRSEESADVKRNPDGTVCEDCK